MLLSLTISALAICVLTCALYLPRHHRSDIAAAYLLIGLGLSMIMVTLRQATTLGAGFGLGILGVLSVFRLRSVVIDHHDVPTSLRHSASRSSEDSPLSRGHARYVGVGRCISPRREKVQISPALTSLLGSRTGKS